MKFFGLARSTLLVVIVLIACAESGYVALVSPPGEGADEWEHIDQALHFVVEGRLPELATEDVGQAQHPPLAYLLEALAYRTLDGRFDPEDESSSSPPPVILGRRLRYAFDQKRSEMLPAVTESNPARTRQAATRIGVFIAMRFLSVVLGLGSALLLLACLRRFFPVAPDLALAATAFIVLLPGWTAHFAFVSSDPLLTFLSLAATWLVLRGRDSGALHQPLRLILPAALLGLAFLTKAHAIAPAVFIGLLTLGDPRVRFRVRLRSLAILATGPLFLAGWWYALRIKETGGLLALEHHAELKPWLLRLQEFHPVFGPLDVLGRLFHSFFGQIGAIGLEAPELFFLPPMAFALMALVGCLLPRTKRANGRRSPRGTRVTTTAAPEDENATAPPPENVELSIAGERTPGRLPALASLALMTLAIVIANRHYQHIHGRYFLALAPALGLLLAEGWRRLAGARAATLLGLGAAFNLVFLVFSIQITLASTMTVEASKFERGRVIAYRDCGHRFFDDRYAGGYPALRQYAGANLPRHSIRATADEGLRYRFDVPDPTRPLQLRIRYPDAALRGQGDLPMPSAIRLFADEALLHGPISIGQRAGELVYPLPAEILADGEVELRWENRVRGGFGVAVAEIWLEEAWLQARDLVWISTRRELSFVIDNIDGAAPQSGTLALRDADGPVALVETERRFELAAGESRGLRLNLPRAIDPASCELRLFPDEQGPLVDLKLAYFHGPEARLSGVSALADLETLRLDPEAAPTVLAEADLGLLPAGRLGLSLSSNPRSLEPLDSLLRLEMEGATLVSGWNVGATDDLGFTRSLIKIERPAATLPLLFRLSLIKGPSRSLQLDRLALERAPEDERRGYRYRLAENE